MDSTAPDQSIISFCTGIGGLERGIRLAGVKIKPILYVEVEAVLCENLVNAMQAGEVAAAPIWTDIKTFDGTKFHGLVDGIIGGYPCVSFSLAGLRRGEEDPRHLWPFIRTHVQTIKPLFCFFENVDDHLTLGFDTVYRDLSALGYCVEAGVFSAAEAGAPHERQRIFILAVASHYRNSGGLRELFGQDEGVQTGRNGTEHAGEMADTNAGGGASGPGEISEESEESEEIEGAQHGQEWDEVFGQRSGAESGDSGDELANTNFRRTQSGEHTGVGRQWEQISWPAGPGQEQYEWEYPRTLTREVELHVGLSTYGYNFREDFLRALGNMVVPQQAAIAMRNLIQKHYESIKKN